MASVNKVILLGHTGRDPEVRYFDNGRAVANVSLATSESYKNKMGEKIDRTEWHKVVFWTPLAEIVEKYLKKGMQVYVEGKISTRSYDDKEGNKRYVTEVEARELVLLRGDAQGGGAPGGGDSAHTPQGDTQGPRPLAEGTGEQAGGASADDLPF